MLIKDGGRSVLIKGGHLTVDTLTDILLTQSEKSFTAVRGSKLYILMEQDALASAVAAELLKDLLRSLQIAPENMCSRQYVQRQFGGSHGPLNHAHTISKMAI